MDSEAKEREIEDFRENVLPFYKRIVERQMIEEVRQRMAKERRKYADIPKNLL